MATTGGRLAWQQFLDECPEGRLVEWVDGEVVEHLPPLRRHQDVALFLAQLLSLWAEHARLGRIMIAPFAMRLFPSGPSREPDVLFIADAHLDRLLPTHLEGPADLVVEVLSEDSEKRDRVEKFDEYARAGVGEYWIVDARPGRYGAEFWTLGADRRYRELSVGVHDVVRSLALPGFWLDVTWLLADPLPAAGRTFRRIVGPPADAGAR